MAVKGTYFNMLLQNVDLDVGGTIGWKFFLWAAVVVPTVSVPMDNV